MEEFLENRFSDSHGLLQPPKITDNCISHFSAGMSEILYRNSSHITVEQKLVW